MLTRLDHLVILVRDLEVTSADYERPGFTVTPGVSHLEISAPDKESAANSLAALADKAPPVRLGYCTLLPVDARAEDAQRPGPSAVELAVGDAGACGSSILPSPTAPDSVCGLESGSAIG